MKAAELFVKGLENEEAEHVFGIPGDENIEDAESFGAKGHRVSSASDLLPTLRRALADDTAVLIDCPVDYAENMTQTAKSKEMASPL